MRFARLLLSLAMLLTAVCPLLPLRAHEVPRHVGVRAWVRPLPDRVQLLVQIPMNAVRDVDFPVLANDALDGGRAAPYLRDAAQLWLADAIRLRDGGLALPAPQVVHVRAALPADRAFGTFATALDAVARGTVDALDALPHGQLRLEALLEVPVSALPHEPVLVPRWANLGVRTTSVVTLVHAGGAERVFTFEGAPDALHLDPRWWHAATRFVRDGAGHMLGGLDHLLFVVCLVLPFRQWRALVGLVTAFTVAHSITLMGAALGYAPDAAWFSPLVEVLIAVSIVFMAVENMLGARLERRWYIAFAFGLVHGFGFSGALRDSLQFAGTHLYTALVAFNLGVELAQLALLLVLVPALDRLFARTIPERAGVVIASAFVAHEAWHWMQERWAELRAQPFTMPAFDGALLLAVVRVALVLAVLTGIAWAVKALLARLVTARIGSARLGSAGTAAVRAASAVFMAALTLGVLRPTRVMAQPPRSTSSGAFTAEQATKGREVFNSMCLGCHTTASHQGTAFQLKWFNRPLYDLYDYVSQMMPKAAPGSLTEDEYVWVTAYILKLNGMPAGKVELSADPAWLKAVRVDSGAVGRSAAAPATGRAAPEKQQNSRR